MFRDNGDTHDTGHTCDDLGDHRRGYSFGVRSRIARNPETIDKSLASSDIPTGSTKRLGECPHKYVNIARVHAEVVTDTSSMRTKRTNGVSLINEQIELRPEVSVRICDIITDHTLYFFLSSKSSGNLTIVPSIL